MLLQKCKIERVRKMKKLNYEEMGPLKELVKPGVMAIAAGVLVLIPSIADMSIYETIAINMTAIFLELLCLTELKKMDNK